MEKQENTKSQKNNLIIDACGSDLVKIWLNSQDKDHILFSSQEKNFKNETILKEIIQALNKKNLKLQSLSNLYVCAGPGSYMGTRTIAVIINTIAQETGITIWQFNHNQKFESSQQVSEIIPNYQR